MLEDDRVKNSADGAGRGGALGDCFGVVADADQIGESPEDLSDADIDAMEVEGALEEYGDRNDTGQNEEPEKGAAFLQKFGHG